MSTVGEKWTEIIHSGRENNSLEQNIFPLSPTPNSAADAEKSHFEESELGNWVVPLFLYQKGHFMDYFLITGVWLEQPVEGVLAPRAIEAWVILSKTFQLKPHFQGVKENVHCLVKLSLPKRQLALQC